jgi:chromosome segregation ATPase
MSITPAIQPSPAPSSSKPLPQTSVEKDLTPLQVIFKPPSSEVIRGNLIRVLENKEYRIYGAYLTGVTAVRAGLEIVPRVGKFLLNTATWFVDITSPREDGTKIMVRDLSDAIHCMKTAIALPFFAVAGLLFPEDIFGLFANMPGVESKVDVPQHKAELAQIQANKNQVTSERDEAQEQLATLREQLTKTRQEHEVARAQLSNVSNILKTLVKPGESVAEAERLQTEVGRLNSVMTDLQEQEKELLKKIQGHRKELEEARAEFEQSKEKAHLDLLTLQEEIKKGQARISTDQETLKKINKSLDELQQRHFELDKEYQGLEKIDLPALIKRRETLAQETEELERQKGTLTVEITSEQETLANLQGQIQNLKVTLAGLEQKESHLTAALLKLEGQVKSLEQRQLEIGAEISQKEEILNGLTKDLEAKRAEQKSLEENPATTQKTLAGNSDDSTAPVSGAAPQEGITTLQEQHRSLEARIVERTTQENTLKQSIETLELQIKELESRLNQRSTELEKTDKAVVANRTALEEIAQKSTEYQTQLKVNLDNLKDKIEKGQADLNRINAQLKAAREERKNLLSRNQPKTFDHKLDTPTENGTASEERKSDESDE